MALERIHRLKNEEVATDACLSAAAPGDLVVLMPTDVEGFWARVLNFQPSVPAGAANHAEPAHADTL